ncbi:MAG: alanine--tRNA ligase, partial [Solirubrobacteraceae bacterium]|nr:alanine--tRNA ligase [Solirubrobacteraceae bacterium]
DRGRSRLCACPCQSKCFRTPDIDNVGVTARHLTCFEMLGNFSIGDYFKQGAVEMAWEFSTSADGLAFDPESVWVTVFGGDEELGLGPDQEAIDAWKSVGVPDERIVLAGREDNFWQAGPTGPCGPCSELYFDRGPEVGDDTERPAGEGERYLEFWNLVFMQYRMGEDGSLTPLPNQNIDTGLGLNRMALIKQGVDNVFETDQFAPLIELGKQLATKETDDRALRILADHTRATTFLLADGVVPSNEDRGYILRRIMRRAILQGHRIGIEPGFLPKYVEKVVEIMGAGYPELAREREAIDRWVVAEEEGFGRTLEQGTKLFAEVAERSKASGKISAEDAFKLHDTYGFPFDVTQDLAEEQGLEVNPDGFDVLMDQQRERARAGAGGSATSGAGFRDAAAEFVTKSASTEFVGYTDLESLATVVATQPQGEVVLVKLDKSPFYAIGGGQISDSGTLTTPAGTVTVGDVVRIGEDQTLVVSHADADALAEGTTVDATVDHAARFRTQANHTATHLLQAALRDAVGGHVRQAGSYVGPDKLRFDFIHGQGLSQDELRAVEDAVNAWIAADAPVKWQSLPLDEARERGATALFGEKYGDVVRMVEVGDGNWSRELCGGTHVARTSEIGAFTIVSESSRSANVRRIEALTGPAAVERLRESDRLLRESAALLRTAPDQLSGSISALREQLKASEKARREAQTADVDSLLTDPILIPSGGKLVARTVDIDDGKALAQLAESARQKLGEDAVIVFGADIGGKPLIVVNVGAELVTRGVSAGDVVKAAAPLIGGGGGGRPNAAQAGGKNAAGLGDAIESARATVLAAAGA